MSVGFPEWILLEQNLWGLSPGLIIQAVTEFAISLSLCMCEALIKTGFLCTGAAGTHFGHSCPTQAEEVEVPLGRGDANM